MKTALFILIGLLLLALAGFALFVAFATPHAWPIPAGTIRAEKIRIGDEAFVMVDGEGMNYLAQIQSLNVAADPDHKRFIVSRYRISYNPFTRIVVNNQWPVIYSLQSLPSGSYSVVYQSTAGETEAGKIDVP